MIKDDPRWWAPPLFNLYIDRLMQRHFHGIRLLGSSPDLDPRIPVLLTPNHSTWWDGFFVYLLNRRLWRRPFHLMMLEEQLAQNLFFQKLGVYGIRQDSLSEVRKAVMHTVARLEQREGMTIGRRVQGALDRSSDNIWTPDLPTAPALVWYPQGELLPWDRRPLGVKRGLERVVKRYRKPLQMLPVGIKPVFLRDQRPDLFLQCGGPVRFEGEGWQAEAWDERMVALLDEMTERIAKGERGRLLLRGQPSVNERMSTLGKRFRRIVR
ncbi:hypothetical protein GF324_02285 [bacterium]|nr:hypothetical protein [bacterium]